MNLRLANMINGLVFPHDHVCYFQSQYGHHRSLGYFKSDSVPHEVALRFFLGDTITIVDATSHNKPYTDTQKFGVVTWCMVMNRAMNQWVDWVADWQTRDMVSAARSQIHKPYVQTLRKLIRIFGSKHPAIIGETVFIECHRNFKADDKPEVISKMVGKGNR